MIKIYNPKKNRTVKRLKKTSTRKTRTEQKTIKKILVPIDEFKNSFNALDMAISLSSHYSASITGVYIFDLPVRLEFSSIDPVGQRLKKKIQRVMNSAKSHATKNHVKFEYLIKHGTIGPEIINTAKKGNFDIIVMGKKNVSAIGEIFLGSVSHYVVHHSKIPVFIVK